jgi:hypothetical protein
MTRLQLSSIVADELARVGRAPDVGGSGRVRETKFFADLPGFGLRTYTSGRASYIVQTRMDGAMRTVTIGRSAVLTRALARDVARRVLLRAQVGFS